MPEFVDELLPITYSRSTHYLSPEDPTNIYKSYIWDQITKKGDLSGVVKAVSRVFWNKTGQKSEDRRQNEHRATFFRKEA